MMVQILRRVLLWVLWVLLWTLLWVVVVASTSTSISASCTFTLSTWRYESGSVRQSNQTLHACVLCVTITQYRM